MKKYSGKTGKIEEKKSKIISKNEKNMWEINGDSI